MTTNDTSALKKALTDEFTLLQSELRSVGRVNPENAEDWEASVESPVTDTAEVEMRAGEITDFEDRSAVEYSLEERYKEVRSALERLASGVYGTCSVCKKAVERDRLKANPAARTCKEHRDSK